MQHFRKIFWSGLAARLLCVPFLLQWFHPDERQMLEFAHFHAHGRLHPFLESQLHLRNQTLPWLFSWLLKFLDSLGLASPRAYLIGMQSLIAVWTWLGFWALLTPVQEAHQEADSHRTVRTVTWLGWFFALFWGFPFLYSRPLLEAVSFAPACFLFLSIGRRQFLRAGFWAGLGGVLRYPSILWGVGAVALCLWDGLQSRRPANRLISDLLRGVSGFVIALALGGLADGAVYGQFLESAFSYWSFNRPGGPVQQMFGDDSLWVYWKWFTFLFTPWLAPLFLGVAAYGLLRVPRLFIFCLPYLLGHLYTPHREPRFLLPLTPFLVVAGAQGLAMIWPRVRTALGPRLERIAVGVLFLHWLFNFVWYPLNAWAQWHSVQGVLLRHYPEMVLKASRLITLADPLIDVEVPPAVNWGDQKCQWHRPENASVQESPDQEFWVLAREGQELNGCQRIDGNNAFSGRLLTGVERIFRVREGGLWSCGKARDRKSIEQWLGRSAGISCPAGWLPSSPGEPLMAEHL
jgi:hypothetical protein